MWRVILVDDEEYVRAELAAIFPWERFRFNLVGEAENAQSAIELIKKAQPDVVITDIRMPGMDGLELITWLRKDYPEIIVAVVSAFNDFPYVREALRLGAVDYLIKAEATVETASVFLERIDGILEQHYSFLFEREEINTNMARYHQLAVESFWRDVLTRASDEKEIRVRAKELGVIFENDRFALIFIHISNYHHSSGEHQQLIQLGLKEKIQSNWDWDWNWNIINLPRGDFIIISSCNAEKFDIKTPEKLRNIAHRLIEKFSEKITISVSSKFCLFQDLSHHFREVQEANLLRFYRQDENFFEIDSLLKLQNRMYQQTPELLVTWERMLRGVDQDEVNQFLNDIFKNIIPNSFGPNGARQLLLNFINILRRISFEYQVQWDEEKDLETDFLGILEEADSIQDWQNQIEKMVGQFINKIKFNNLPQGSSTIRKALVYIQSNFTRDLSLEEVAGHAGVSKSYLCRVFPEYTGEHYSNYLQRLRIERAKELLRFTDEHIYEIALKVGFWNSRYFSKIFHEMVGRTPADYRRDLPLK